MFELGIASREIFLAYSTQFVFSTIRLVPVNVVIVAIDMWGKSPITGELIYGITWKHVYFNIFIFFIVDTASVLKSLFPTVYRFYLDGYVGGCFCCFYLFHLFICLIIYLFINYFSTASTVILIFVVVVVITSVAFVVGVIVALCGCLVIVAASLMLMFSILVLLFAPYFTVNSVDK